MRASSLCGAFYDWLTIYRCRSANWAAFVAVSAAFIAYRYWPLPVDLLRPTSINLVPAQRRRARSAHDVRVFNDRTRRGLEMINRRIALLGAALAAMTIAVPALAQKLPAQDLKLPREQVKLVAPPFV